MRTRLTRGYVVLKLPYLYVHALAVAKLVRLRSIFESVGMRICVRSCVVGCVMASGTSERCYSVRVGSALDDSKNNIGSSRYDPLRLTLALRSPQRTPPPPPRPPAHHPPAPRLLE